MTIRAIILALQLALTLPAAAQNDNPVKQASAPENSVKLAAIVSPEGEAKEINIIESGGYSKFDKAAVAAAQKGNYNATGRWMKYFATVEFKPQ